MKPVLLDAGVVVTLLHRKATRHAECVRVVSDLDRPLVTCEAVISESCHLLRGVPDAPEAVLANIEQGLFQIPFQLGGAAARIREIMHKYRNLPASFADACLISLADDLNTGDILTLDSDFIAYRWRKTRPFELLIPL